MNVKVIAMCFLLLSFWACGTKTKNNIAGKQFTIKCAIAGVKNKKIYLNRVIDGELVKIDSTSAINNTFMFGGNLNSPELLYITTFDNSGYLKLFAENSNIQITGHIDSMENAQIVGSAAQNQYNSYLENLSVYENKQNALYKQYQEAQSKRNKKLMQEIDTTYQKLVIEKFEFQKHYVQENDSSVVAVYVALNHLSDDLGAKDIDSVVMHFSSKLSNSMYMDLLKEKQKLISNIEPGKAAPAIEEPNIDGEIIALSSFKGKIVLLDFWASWCKPCRETNTDLAKLYAKYNSLGFEIVSISLDNYKKQWERAIKKDKIKWVQLSPLVGWKCKPVKVYNVTSIPHSVLIDKDGTIVETNLSFLQLDEQIGDLVGYKN